MTKSRIDSIDLLRGLVIFLPRIAILAFSLVVVFGHNLLDYVSPEVLARWDTALPWSRRPFVRLSAIPSRLYRLRTA